MLSLIASAVAYAQHFKFMGIELDSTMNNFDVQIKQKGFQNSKRFSSFNTSREKWYDGFFAGYDVGCLFVLVIKRTEYMLQISFAMLVKKRP